MKAPRRILATVWALRALCGCAQQLPEDADGCVERCLVDADDKDLAPPDDDASAAVDVATVDLALPDAVGADAGLRDAGATTDVPLSRDAVTVLDAPLARDVVLMPADVPLARDAVAVLDVPLLRDVVIVPIDRGPADTGVPTGSCVSGAVGSYAARFRWTGSGTTATVNLELNNLPDRSRWRVTANSMSIGYRPVFTDTGLGEGGLELSGTGFIDVELSTSGLAGVRAATIAVYGRSFSTGSSGSFTWQTFSGTGMSGLVANSAPYRWYRADATTALPAGNAGTLLRLRAGSPSGALIVNRVEVCFDAS